MTVPVQADKPQSHVQSIFGSFAAGVAVMTVLGAMGAFVANGGLSTPTAAASTPAEAAFAGAPTVRPLDVAQVQAQLADVEAEMLEVQTVTDAAMKRLEALSGR